MNANVNLEPRDSVSAFNSYECIQTRAICSHWPLTFANNTFGMCNEYNSGQWERVKERKGEREKENDGGEGKR